LHSKKSLSDHLWPGGPLKATILSVTHQIKSHNRPTQFGHSEMRHVNRLYVSESLCLWLPTEGLVALLEGQLNNLHLRNYGLTMKLIISSLSHHKSLLFVEVIIFTHYTTLTMIAKDFCSGLHVFPVFFFLSIVCIPYKWAMSYLFLSAVQGIHIFILL